MGWFNDNKDNDGRAAEDTSKKSFQPMAVIVLFAVAALSFVLIANEKLDRLEERIQRLENAVVNLRIQ